jgi:hypothetical protein
MLMSSVASEPEKEDEELHDEKEESPSFELRDSFSSASEDHEDTEVLANDCNEDAGGIMAPVVKTSPMMTLIPTLVTSTAPTLPGLLIALNVV